MKLSRSDFENNSILNDYKISETEFKNIFNLGSKYIVPESSLNTYTNYIIGSWLLYDEIYNINAKKFSIYFKNEKIDLSARCCDHTCYQNWVSPLGSLMKIKVEYFDPNKSKGTTPFWTYTKFNDNARMVSRLAYQEMCNVLNNIRAKYLSKYQIMLLYRDFSVEDYSPHPNDGLWLDGVEFISNLVVINEQGNSELISDYQIGNSITNRDNIWVGKLPEFISSTINKLKLKS